MRITITGKASLNGSRPGKVLAVDSHEAVIGLATDVEAVFVYINEDDHHVELWEHLVDVGDPLRDGLWHHAALSRRTSPCAGSNCRMREICFLLRERARQRLAYCEALAPVLNDETKS